MHMYGSFEGFPFNSALFGLVLYVLLSTPPLFPYGRDDHQPDSRGSKKPITV